MSKALTKFSEVLLNEILKLEKRDDTRKTEIVEAIRRSHPAEIRDCSKELEDIAIKRMIDRLSKRSGSGISDGPDLFGHFHGLERSIVVPGTEDERRECKRKLLQNATIAEVKLRVAAEKVVRAKKAEKETPLSRLLKELTPFALSDDTTILEAFRLAFPEATMDSEAVG